MGLNKASPRKALFGEVMAPQQVLNKKFYHFPYGSLIRNRTKIDFLILICIILHFPYDSLNRNSGLRAANKKRDR